MCKHRTLFSVHISCRHISPKLALSIPTILPTSAMVTAGDFLAVCDLLSFLGQRGAGRRLGRRSRGSLAGRVREDLVSPHNVLPPAAMSLSIRLAARVLCHNNIHTSSAHEADIFCHQGRLHTHSKAAARHLMEHNAGKLLPFNCASVRSRCYSACMSLSSAGGRVLTWRALSPSHPCHGSVALATAQAPSSPSHPFLLPAWPAHTHLTSNPNPTPPHPILVTDHCSTPSENVTHTSSPMPWGPQ